MAVKNRGGRVSAAKGVKAVVVLSGGQDSATALALAVRRPAGFVKIVKAASDPT